MMFWVHSLFPSMFMVNFFLFLFFGTAVYFYYFFVMCSKMVFPWVNIWAFSTHNALAKKQTNPKPKICLHVLFYNLDHDLIPEIYRLFWLRILYVEMAPALAVRIIRIRYNCKTKLTYNFNTDSRRGKRGQWWRLAVREDNTIFFFLHLNLSRSLTAFWVS